MTQPLRTQVLIIGGGPVGLTMAGLLAKQGVRSIVVERRNETMRAPAAHVLRNRARAVLGLLGIEDEIERNIPHLPMHYITWCATLGGSELGRLDISSPNPGVRSWTNLSQNRLEPLLIDVALAHAEIDLRIGSLCESVAQGDDSVCAKIISVDGTEHVIDADWVVAADGAGSRTRKNLGIEMLGNGPLGRFFMVHFRADLSPWIDHRPGPIFWINHPEAPGTLIIHDLKQSHVFMTPMNGTDGEMDAIPARLASALNIGIDVDIISIDTWMPYCQVAERYRDGRIFLVGDAAHRFPPSGGLGLNTGLLEAHNLAAKLASVVNGKADAGLLSAYEAECRPAAQANADESLMNAMRLGLISGAIGGCFDIDALETRIATMNDDERAVLADAIEQQRSHFMSDGVYPGPPGDPILEGVA
jgi:2,4-dichlorophenol 6-monooxygenase